MSKVSLVSKKSGGEVAVLDMPASSLAEFDGGSVAAPFVAFAYRVSQDYWPKWDAAIPGLQEGNPVLDRGDVYPAIGLNPFKFCLWDYFKFYADLDANGQPTRVSLTKYDGGIEHFETVLLVFMPDGGVTPATCRFKKATTRCINTAAQTLQIASDDSAWAKMGEAYRKVGLLIPEPKLRFVTTAKMNRRTSKTSGKPYTECLGVCRPIESDEVDAIREAGKDAIFRQQAEAVNERFKGRVEELRNKVV